MGKTLKKKRHKTTSNNSRQKDNFVQVKIIATVKTHTQKTFISMARSGLFPNAKEAQKIGGESSLHIQETNPTQTTRPTNSALLVTTTSDEVSPRLRRPPSSATMTAECPGSEL